jgi:hypothetical protein
MDTFILDMVNNDAFSLVALTDSINVIPNVYGRLNDLGLFPFQGVTSSKVAVEISNGTLNIIPQQPRGGPANQNQHKKRQMRYYDIPHFPLEDVIKSEDLERVRAFGAADRTVALAQLIADRQQEMALKHFITMEFLRNGALKGLVMDATGAVILDIFAEFGITEQVFYFDLDNKDANINATCQAINYHITKNLLGDIKSYVHCLCDKDFFAGLTNHPKVIEAYKFYQESNPLRDDLTEGFKHQGIFFEVYPGEAVDPEGTVHKFIPVGEARFFPMGTAQTFRTYGAPADFLETVGTYGMPMYSKLFADQQLNRWLGVHTQSNPLPICLRPSVLVRGLTTAAPH